MKNRSTVALEGGRVMSEVTIRVRAETVKINATGMRPREEVEELSNMLNVAAGTDGFFMEAHPKLGAVESSVAGIYLAGCCQGPKDIPDSVAQASAAAAMACIALYRVTKEPALP